MTSSKRRTRLRHPGLRDRNLKFHRYAFVEPSPHVQALLDHIEGSGDPIF
nr:DUF3024 domain-containing protein [Rhodococcus sp. OK302]